MLSSLRIYRNTVRLGELEIRTSRIGFVIIISYDIELFWVLANKREPRLKKTSTFILGATLKSTWIEHNKRNKKKKKLCRK